VYGLFRHAEGVVRDAQAEGRHGRSKKGYLSEAGIMKPTSLNGQRLRRH
jgi:hypothetical protein